MVVVGKGRTLETGGVLQCAVHFDNAVVDLHFVDETPASFPPHDSPVVLKEVCAGGVEDASLMPQVSTLVRPGVQLPSQNQKVALLAATHCGTYTG